MKSLVSRFKFLGQITRYSRAQQGLLYALWKANDDVSPDEDPLVLHVHLVQRQALQRRHRGVLGVLENGGGNKCDERGLTWFDHLFAF